MNHYLQTKKGTSQGREVLAEIKTHSAQTYLWKHQNESHGPSGKSKNSFLFFQNTNKQFMQGTVLQLQCLPRQKELHASPLFSWHTTSFFWIFHQQDHHNNKQISSSQPNSCHGQNHLLREMLQTFTPVTEQFVLEILQKSVLKSCDLDPISTKLLYENLDVLLPTITNIINTSLASGLVPPDFKTAIVKPLLKKPSLDQNVLKKLPSNLKPAISV